MATRIQLRRDISANWISRNPILAEGEIGIETDTNKLKIGNGVSAWNILNYYESAISNHSELNLDDGTNPHGTTKQDVGLNNVDNTSDVDKPISTATQTALNSKLDKDTTAGVERVYTINPDGSQATKPTSELGGDTFTLTFHIVAKTWVLDTWYQQYSGSGFNISGNTAYGTGAIPTSTVHLNGSWLLIPSGFIIDKVTFGVQGISSALSGTAYRNEVYITRGEVTLEQNNNSQTNIEVLCQQEIDFQGVVLNSKFLKDLTIASHTAKTLSILQVVMREKLYNNANYSVVMNITFKKA